MNYLIPIGNITISALDVIRLMRQDSIDSRERLKALEIQVEAQLRALDRQADLITDAMNNYTKMIMAGAKKEDAQLVLDFLNTTIKNTSRITGY